MRDYFEVLGLAGTLATIGAFLGVVAGAVALFSVGSTGIGIGYIVFLLLFVFLARKYFIYPLVQSKRILRTGELAEAVIVEIQENGSSLKLGGALPKAGVDMTVDVHPQGKPVYRGRIQTYISTLEMPRYQPGTHVQVKYDPANPTQVVMVEEQNVLAHSKLS